MTNCTCRKEERLEIGEDVHQLSVLVLEDTEIEAADTLAKKLVGTKSERGMGILELKRMFPPVPKRPLYYLTFMHLDHLPNWTRDPIKYMGDYVDLLTKAMLYSKIKDDKFNGKALKAVVEKIRSKNILPEKLVDELVKYDEVFYVPAKHDWNARGRRHRFTTREVAYCAFITKKFESILRKDEYVDKVAKEEIDFDSYTPRFSNPFSR